MRLLELAFILAIISCGVVFIVGQKSDYIILMLNKDDLAPKTDTLVLVPTLTANAYKVGSFYDYYSGKCGAECLTTTISYNVDLGEAGSENAVRTLKRIGYVTELDFIVDYKLRTDPNWLETYHTVIVLHNEYVTQRIFDALQKHSHVVYLAPNANHAMVSVDGPIMTLVQGHGYNNMYNGFGWEYDNTSLESDKECENWRFDPIPNGYQLNCNPELTIHSNIQLLKTLKDL